MSGRDRLAGAATRLQRLHWKGVDPSRFYRYLRRVSEWLIFAGEREIKLREVRIALVTAKGGRRGSIKDLKVPRGLRLQFPPVSAAKR
jgi:hypothetical protein